MCLCIPPYREINFMSHNQTPPETTPVADDTVLNPEASSERQTDVNPFLSKAKLSKSITLWLIACILILFFSSHIVNPNGINWTVLILQSLPLVLLIPSLKSGHYRAYSWLCFIMLLYFIFAVMGALKSTAGLFDYLFLLFIVTLFNVVMMASRWLQRVQKNTI